MGIGRYWSGEERNRLGMVLVISWLVSTKEAQG